MSELFDVNVLAINKHLTNIYDLKALEKDSTISKMKIVRKEGNRNVSREYVGGFMDSNVIIETERLILRQFKLSDVDDLVEGLNNINVSKWLAYIPYPYTREDAFEYITSSIKDNLYNFAIVLKSENKVIGGTQISNISKIHGTAGGGIWLNEKYHGNGYGTEAWGARIRYAFNELGLRRLENGYFKDNIASYKMQEKFGYKNEGIRREKFIAMSTGKIEDEYVTGLLKEEWIEYDKR